MQKKKKKKINTDWNEWALVNDVTGQNTKLSCDYENLSDALDVSPWTRSLIDWNQDLSKLHARAQISEASCQGNTKADRIFLFKKKKRTVRSITRCHCLCTCKKHRPAFTRGSERLVQAGNTLNFNVCLPATVPASLTACLFPSHAGTRATLIRREPRRRMQKKKKISPWSNISIWEKKWKSAFKKVLNNKATDDVLPVLEMIHALIILALKNLGQWCSNVSSPALSSILSIY